MDVIFLISPIWLSNNVTAFTGDGVYLLLTNVKKIILRFPQMQKKIDTLQEELHQAKTSNHNHTFADAERIAEVSSPFVSENRRKICTMRLWQE